MVNLIMKLQKYSRSTEYLGIDKLLFPTCYHLNKHQQSSLDRLMPISLRIALFKFWESTKVGRARVAFMGRIIQQTREVVRRNSPSINLPMPPSLAEISEEYESAYVDKVHQSGRHPSRHHPKSLSNLL